MQTWYQRLIQWVDERVGLPDDSEVQRTRKVIAAVAAIFGAPLTLIWIIGPLLVGYDLVAGIFAAYLLVQIANITIYFSTRRFGPFAFVALGGVLLAPFLAQAALGGFVPSGLQALWALIAPIVAVAVLPGGRAVRWFGAYVVLALLSAILDPTFARLAPDIPRQFSTINALMNVIMMGGLVVGVLMYAVSELNQARERADNLLLNILPAPIAKQLKREQGTIAEGYDAVTVLFADIVDFTRLSANADPVQVVEMLNAVFSDFDALAARYGLEKIKTIGDAYMVACGVPDPRPDHAEATVEMALAMLETLKQHRAWNGDEINLRIGINSGPAVAGVIGTHKFIYDLWGDVVNTASRMESNGKGGIVQVTEDTYDMLKDHYAFEAREPIQVKGKGLMSTYLLQGRRA